MSEININSDDDSGDNFESYENQELDEQLRVTKFIEDIIKSHTNKGKMPKRDSKNDYRNLLSINSEWLDSFMIIGYDMSGEEVVLTNTKNTKDYNAMLNVLKKAFIHFVVKSEME